MKGIILSGGLGTRLDPLTRVTSKQLLPIYDKPMIYYPLDVLVKAGIKDILVIVAPDHCGDYMKLLGSGKKLGVRFAYEIQDKPEGIAQALLIGETFIDDDDVTLILGDNIYEEDLSLAIGQFKAGAKIFAKEVKDPERFGVIVFDENMKPTKILEKPKEHVGNYVQTGLYIYDNRAIDFARQLKPSPRGELEITDLTNKYLEIGELEVELLKGEWIDAGTFEALYRANELAYKKAHTQSA